MFNRPSLNLEKLQHPSLNPVHENSIQSSNLEKLPHPSPDSKNFDSNLSKIYLYNITVVSATQTQTSTTHAKIKTSDNQIEIKEKSNENSSSEVTFKSSIKNKLIENSDINDNNISRESSFVPSTLKILNPPPLTETPETVQEETKEQTMLENPLEKLQKEKLKDKKYIIRSRISEDKILGKITIQYESIL